jgi:serine/threonine protein kinase
MVSNASNVCEVSARVAYSVNQSKGATPMNPSTIFCDNCGAANRPTARFCISCGQALPAASALPPTAQVGAAVSSPPTPPLAQTTPAPTSPSLTGLLPANSLLNQRYRIVRQLGQGGMGAVYQAEDTRLGDQLVAVKEMSQSELKSQQAITEATQAFPSEAIMLARLRHAHLPRIYDHFEDNNRWYLVMDFIPGETLEEYLAKAGGKLPVTEVLEIGIQLCNVLGYLHSQQPPIIFRDLKPANIMRTPDGDLFLIDFGIARHFKPGQAKDTAAYGSMGYAPPEQYGKAQTTPQSDIYSLGATLHHLLSGNDPSQAPFRFAPLSAASIPAGLSTLIAQMLEMDADKRPTSMAEVKQQLQRIAAQPAASPLPPTVYVGGSGLAANPPLAQQPSFVSPPPLQVERISQPTGTILYTYRVHSNWVNAVAWSPDGRRIASGSKDGMVQVWDATDGGHVFTYRGHSGHSDGVFTVAWSPDGTRIASGSQDHTVQVW